MRNKTLKNSPLQAHRQKILVGLIVLVGVVLSVSALGFWSEAFIYKRAVTGLQQYVPLPINNTNTTNINNIETIIYGVGYSNPYLYYTNQTLTNILNAENNFWKVQTEGFGITNYSRTSGTPPDNLTIFIPFDNNLTKEFINNITGVINRNVSLNFSYIHYFGGAKFGNAEGGNSNGGRIDYSNINAFNYPKGTALIYFQAPATCGVTYNSIFSESSDQSAYIGSVGIGENAFALKLGNAGKLIDTACNSPAWWNAGDWVHLIVTWDTDSDNYAVYVNKILKATSTTSEVKSNSTGLRIGEINTQPTGNITHIVMFNKVLNSSEINATYDLGTSLGNQETTTTTTGNCNENSDRILNFSLKDEATKTILEGNISLDIQLKNSTTTQNYSATYTKVNETSICIDREILGTYYLYGTINYQAPSRVSEFYYLQNYTLTSSTKLNISLYDLLIADSTSFLFTFKDYNEDEVKDALIKVWRKYIGTGNYEVVEIGKTNENGESIIHLVEEDVIYYFEVGKEGSLLLNSTEGIALCQEVPCTLVYRQTGGGFEALPYGWFRVNDGSFSWSASRDLRIVNLTFNYTSAHENNLTVYELSTNKSISSSVINSSYLNAANGILTITVPASFGNRTYYATYHRTGSGYAFISNRWLDFNINPVIYFGVMGIFFVGLGILLLFLVALASGVWSIIMALVGLIAFSILGFIKLGQGSLVFIIGAGVIIIIKLLKIFER